MTRTANARIAGFTYLLYIAVAFPSMLLYQRAIRGEGIAAKLAGVAEHATDFRLIIVLSLISCFCALVLGVTLYAITRDEDPDVAILAMVCRVGEGIVGASSIPVTLGLLWLATASGPTAPDASAARTLGVFLLEPSVWNAIIPATFFAVGSTLFCWLLLRGRMIPAPLAWLGVLGSALLVVVLPLQLVGFFRGGMFELVWAPVGIFEVVVAPWLIIKGIAAR